LRIADDQALLAVEHRHALRHVVERGVELLRLLRQRSLGIAQQPNLPGDRSQQIDREQ
jgi:hypothetical protein